MVASTVAQTVLQLPPIEPSFVIEDFFNPAYWTVDDASQFNFVNNTLGSVRNIGESGTATRADFTVPDVARYAVTGITLTTKATLPQYVQDPIYDQPIVYKDGSNLQYVITFSSGIILEILPLAPITSINALSGRITLKESGQPDIVRNVAYQPGVSDGTVSWPDGTIVWNLTMGSKSITANGQSITTQEDIGYITSVVADKLEDTEYTGLFDGTILTYDGTSNVVLSSFGYQLNQYLSVDGAAWPLEEIIKEWCDRSGINEDLLNLNDLVGENNTVYGCFASPDDDAFTLIEELSKLHMFDVCNYDGRLNFIKRGGEVVADISKDELVAGNKDIDKRERRDSIEVPRVLNLEYYDIEGSLTPDKQISDRSLDIRAKDEKKQETAVILSADQAAQMAVITHKVLIEEQGGGYEFSLADNYSWLSVGDLIRLDGLRLRITEIEIDDGFQNYKTLLDRKAAYSSEISGVPPTTPITPSNEIPGDTVFQFLDIPILSDSDDTLQFYSAVNGLDDWRGAVVDLSLDGGANYIDSDSSNTPSIIGYTETELGLGSVYYPDEVNTVRVRMIRDDLELESATLTEMLNRKNLCVIGNELVNFGNASEIEPGLWELDYFLRGRKGSNTTSHAAGTRFVMLRRAVLANVPAETYMINKPLTFRATSVGSDTASSVTTSLYSAQSQTERLPAYLQASRNSGNIDITWQGVGRIGSSANVSQSQYWIGYRVYINDVAEPDQLSENLTITDPGGSVKIEVCQLNRYTGEGPRAEITI